ncbi:muscle M-line assembly protein unc-89-like [Aplysia californica]|uniref:Muscle M-line assembly protein unc-89-like n=1 Tax=Aplysia californica TaxID=6500 RepID=A0ABM1W0L2_APLCA|nr:muscle M-line assembly protein unc-89-like [Aplysia californica]
MTCDCDGVTDDCGCDVLTTPFWDCGTVSGIVGLFVGLFLGGDEEDRGRKKKRKTEEERSDRHPGVGAIFKDCYVIFSEFCDTNLRKVFQQLSFEDKDCIIAQVSKAMDAYGLGVVSWACRFLILPKTGMDYLAIMTSRNDLEETERQWLLSLLNPDGPSRSHVRDAFSARQSALSSVSEADQESKSPSNFPDKDAESLSNNPHQDIESPTNRPEQDTKSPTNRPEQDIESPTNRPEQDIEPPTDRPDQATGSPANRPDTDTVSPTSQDTGTDLAVSSLAQWMLSLLNPVPLIRSYIRDALSDRQSPQDDVRVVDQETKTHTHGPDKDFKTPSNLPVPDQNVMSPTNLPNQDSKSPTNRPAPPVASEKNVPEATVAVTCHPKTDLRAKLAKEMDNDDGGDDAKSNYEDVIDDDDAEDGGSKGGSNEKCFKSLSQ